MKEKIRLKEIDSERWRFVLYTSPQEEWICDFVYSPKSSVDLSMLIALNEDEKRKAKADREFLIELSENIRNNYKAYLKRSLNKDDFEQM